MAATPPPKFVNLPSQELFNLTLSDAHFRSLAIIRGLAYKTKGESTPPLTIEDLMAYRGLGRSTMFEHLRLLREKGYIRSDLVGTGLFIIYPLRWEPGAALPTGDEDALTPDEIEALTGQAPSPENRTPSPESWTHHDHVVVHDSDHGNQQHASDESRNPDSPHGDVERALAAALGEQGADAASAQETAAELVASHGVEVCARQLAAFDRRCELARASPRGLENPAGLLVASIAGDWPPPSNGAERKRQRWYTDEEYERCFVH